MANRRNRPSNNAMRTTLSTRAARQRSKKARPSAEQPAVAGDATQQTTGAANGTAAVEPSDTSGVPDASDRSGAIDALAAAVEDAAAGASPASRAPARRAVPLRRGYTRARRTWYTLLFVPIFALVTVIELVRAALQRFAAAAEADALPSPRFQRPSTMPEPDSRSVADVVEQLRRFPFRPLPLPARVAFYREFGPDGLGVLLSSQYAMHSLPHLYPSTFKPRLFAGVDGAQLAGLQAMQPHPGPALVICHGLLTTKNFDYIRRIARKAYGEWGFHVIAVDLRGWGQSTWTCDAPSSAGYMEGQDIVQIARDLQRDERVTSVGVLGYSLGGCTALNAARFASQSDDTPIDGGVMAVSAPTDVDRATAHISGRPGLLHPFLGMWLIYRAALRSGVRQLGLDASLNDFRKLIEGYSAPYYGVTMDEYHERASAQRFADDITVPTLQLHAADDFIVPVEHAYGMRDAAASNENVEVWVVDRGNHCAFPAVDERWFTSVLRRWFEYWAEQPEPSRTTA